MNRYDDDQGRGSSHRDQDQDPAGGTGGFKGYGSYGDPPEQGTGLQRQYGGLGAGQVGRQRRPFDPEYAQWRDEQMRRFDEEYGQWRQERQKKFSDEFEQWRKNRPSAQGSTAAGKSTS